MIKSAISKQSILMNPDNLIHLGKFDDYNADFLFNLNKDPFSGADVQDANFDWLTVFHNTWVNQFKYALSRMGVPKCSETVGLYTPSNHKLSKDIRQDRIDRKQYVMCDGRLRTFEKPLGESRNWNTRAKKSFEAFAYELGVYYKVDFLGRMSGTIQSYGTPITKTGNVIYNKKVGHLLYTFSAKPAKSNAHVSEVLEQLDYIPSYIKNPSVCDAYVFGLRDEELKKRINASIIQQEILNVK